MFCLYVCLYIVCVEVVRPPITVLQMLLTTMWVLGMEPLVCWKSCQYSSPLRHLASPRFSLFFSFGKAFKESLKLSGKWGGLMGTDLLTHLTGRLVWCACVAAWCMIDLPSSVEVTSKNSMSTMFQSGCMSAAFTVSIEMRRGRVMLKLSFGAFLSKLGITEPSNVTSLLRLFCMPTAPGCLLSILSGLI